MPILFSSPKTLRSCRQSWDAFESAWNPVWKAGDVRSATKSGIVAMMAAGKRTPSSITFYLRALDAFSLRVGVAGHFDPPMSGVALPCLHFQLFKPRPHLRVLKTVVRCIPFLLLVTSALALAQSTPPPAPQVAGAMNFRDIGGILTSDARVVRRGLIFRSGELNHLTAADFDALASLRVRYIFDLRTNAERAAAPTKWAGSQPEIQPVPVGFPADADSASMMKQIFAGGTDPVHASAGMRSITAMIAVDGAPEIGKVLRALAAGEEPAIIHCTAGKDRTGVVTAVLLVLLGVPRDAVYDDYLKSNEAVPAQMARLSAAAGSGTGLPPELKAMPAETVRVLMGVERSYLEAAFAAIDSKYGSFSEYVSRGLKLTPPDVEALRTRLLTRNK